MCGVATRIAPNKRCRNTIASEMRLPLGTGEQTMNKQIDIPESEMGMSGYSKFSWALWEEGICNMLGAQRADQIMREMGYRRASDVAREIFEEIELLLDTYSASHHSIGEVCGESYFERGLEDAIAELKKKYESEGADDET
jgi:hypothetical protein